MPVALPSIARTLVGGVLAGALLTTTPLLGDAALAAPHHASHHGQQHHAQQHGDHKKHHHGHHHNGPKKSPTERRVERAVNVAAAQKGDPYSYGAAGPSAFDCSGLMYYSFRHAGFSNIPRTSSAQAGFAHRISRSAMKRGDLMFFYDGGGVYHVGMFAGYSHGARIVLHAPYSGTRVRLERVWTDSWFPGTLRNR